MTVSPAVPNTASPFFVTGGSLHGDAPCYVVRQADADIFAALKRGQFCYVLTSRQMGKSSLMVRTTTRLRKEGVAVAVIDLTAVGQNLAPEQWYDGVLMQIGGYLHIENELEDFWLDNGRVAPLQRFLRALREIVLEKISGDVVLMVDEVDAVRSLPFSADEFFAGIRECYNRRTADPAMSRLTFALFGVALPSDLIRDTRSTPFNVGTRIELQDFCLADTKPLEQGAVRPELISRILYWTGGHPYLTLRLCRAVVETPPETHSLTPADMDRLASELYLSPRARENDTNLLFARERILRSEVDIAALLELYRRVWSGRPVPDDETDPLVSVLRLAGIVRSENGLLKVRNRIYARVFDKTWIQANMPEAELRRQRAAFRKGLLRAVALFSVIIATMGGLVIHSVLQTRRANRLAAQLNFANKKLEDDKKLIEAQNQRFQTFLALGNKLKDEKILPPDNNLPEVPQDLLPMTFNKEVLPYATEKGTKTFPVLLSEEQKQIRLADFYRKGVVIYREQAETATDPTRRIDSQRHLADYQYNLGLTYDKLRRYADAIASLTQAQRQYGQFNDVEEWIQKSQIALGGALYHNKDTKAAVTLYQKLLDTVAPQNMKQFFAAADQFRIPSDLQSRLAMRYSFRAEDEPSLPSMIKQSPVIVALYGKKRLLNIRPGADPPKVLCELTGSKPSKVLLRLFDSEGWEIDKWDIPADGYIGLTKDRLELIGSKGQIRIEAYGLDPNNPDSIATAEITVLQSQGMAFIVAINDYDNGQSLNWLVDDGRDVQKQLKKLGYAKANIYTVFGYNGRVEVNGEKTKDAKVTRDVIVREFGRFLLRAKEAGAKHFFLYYSGHGQANDGSIDVADKGKDALVMADFSTIPTHGWADDLLTQIPEYDKKSNSTTPRKMSDLTVVGLYQASRVEGNNVPNRTDAVFADNPEKNNHYYYIQSCRPGEVSYTDKPLTDPDNLGLKHGFFGLALIRVLTKLTPDDLKDFKTNRLQNRIDVALQDIVADAAKKWTKQPLKQSLPDPLLGPPAKLRSLHITEP